MALLALVACSGLHVPELVRHGLTSTSRMQRAVHVPELVRLMIWLAPEGRGYPLSTSSFLKGTNKQLSASHHHMVKSPI